MADERFSRPGEVPDFVSEAEEFLGNGEAGAELPKDAREEVTIKFGKGLVGEPFTSKNGKELVEVSIPNPDRNDTRPWETFVISPKMIHENKYGVGVWMKLPADGKTRLARSERIGTDEAGKPIWGRATREVTNKDLKAIMEVYKDKSRDSVLSDLSNRKDESEPAKPSGKGAKKQEAAR